MDKFLKKLGIKDQNSLLFYTGIAAVSWILATNYFKKGHPLSFYTAYDTATTTTTTTSPTVQELKDKILQNIIQRAQDVNVVITNLDSINAKIETYNAKLELLTSEIAGNRLPTYVIQQYLQSIIKEIADALEIKLNLPMSGGWSGSYAPWYDPLGGYADTNPYSQYYQNYIDNLQNYYGQYYGQFSYYDPQSYYYQPNYYYNQTSPYYSYQQTYNPGYQGYSSQQYGYGYPNYGYSQYPQQGYGGYPGQSGGYGYGGYY